MRSKKKVTMFVILWVVKYTMKTTQKLMKGTPSSISNDNIFFETFLSLLVSQIISNSMLLISNSTYEIRRSQFQFDAYFIKLNIQLYLAFTTVPLKPDLLQLPCKTIHLSSSYHFCNVH